MSWGPWQILLILLIIVLIFGTKKLRNLGADLGSSIKSFKKSMQEEDKEEAAGTDEKPSATDKDKHG